MVFDSFHENQFAQNTGYLGYITKIRETEKSAEMIYLVNKSKSKCIVIQLTKIFLKHL